MFIMENPIQMDDLVVITPILGSLYMSKQMLSCTKLAATKSMAWSCDMTRPLLCRFRFRRPNPLRLWNSKLQKIFLVFVLLK